MQTEGVVVNTDIQYRPRRQLVCLIADPDHREAQLVLRFFTFYPSQQKALQPGQRVRVFGDVRPGYYGLEIVHPQWKAIAEGAPLPDRLTPVYPTTAGLGQDTLRKLIARTMTGNPALHRRHAARHRGQAAQAVEVRRCGALPARAAAAPVGARAEARSMRARIRRGRASSSTSSSRSSSRSRRIARRARSDARRC